MGTLFTTFQRGYVTTGGDPMPSAGPALVVMLAVLIMMFLLFFEFSVIVIFLFGAIYIIGVITAIILQLIFPLDKKNISIINICANSPFSWLYVVLHIMTRIIR